MLLKVFKWELFSGKRFYLIFLLYFLILFSLGQFAYGKTRVETELGSVRTLTPGNMIDIMWGLNDVWWFSFPVVTAYAVFSFSYEFDRGILRTYLLSCIRKRTVFLAKLLSILLGLLIPLIASLLIIYPIADPLLFASNPLEVYANLPRRLLIIVSMLYIMIGISTLSSIAFKKPLYAFAAPIAMIYTLNMAGLRVVSEYVPPKCYSPFTYMSIGLVAEESFCNNLSMSLPAVIASTIALIVAYIIFIKKDIV